MSIKNTVFYRGKKEVLVDFSAQEISSDGALIYLEQLERKHGLLKRISSFIPDNRNPLYTIYDRYSQLKQRVFMLKFFLGFEPATKGRVQHQDNELKPYLTSLMLNCFSGCLLFFRFSLLVC
ncbi:transposase [Brumimicrobium salinarum]|nr:transposase [Brumimicrobium salinarum]